MICYLCGKHGYIWMHLKHRLLVTVVGELMRNSDGVDEGLGLPMFFNILHITLSPFAQAYSTCQNLYLTNKFFHCSDTGHLGLYSVPLRAKPACDVRLTA